MPAPGPQGGPGTGSDHNSDRSSDSAIGIHQGYRCRQHLLRTRKQHRIHPERTPNGKVWIKIPDIRESILIATIIIRRALRTGRKEDLLNHPTRRGHMSGMPFMLQS